MGNNLKKAITNWEEIKTGKTKSELPLIGFTLLTQMAAGIAVFSFFAGPLSLLSLIALGGLIGAGGFVALLHLGTPLNAWRAVLHLKKSWLSREILAFGLFGFSWLLALFFPGMGKMPLALTGFGLVFSMAQVYRLRSIEAWDTNRTLLVFTVSAVFLGGLGLVTLDVVENNDPKIGYFLASMIGLVGALCISLLERHQVHQTARRLRLGLIGLIFIGMLFLFLFPNSTGKGVAVYVLLISLTEESIGRWLFYEYLHQRIL